MKKILFILVLLLLIGIGLVGYQYRNLVVMGWRLATGQKLFNFETTTTNPLEKLEALNPVEQANPFSNSYKNPFE